MGSAYTKIYLYIIYFFWRFCEMFSEKVFSYGLLTRLAAAHTIAAESIACSTWRQQAQQLYKNQRKPRYIHLYIAADDVRKHLAHN